jgi:hypothetical protein
LKSLASRKNIFPIDIEEKITSLCYGDKLKISDNKLSYMLIDGIWLQRWKNYINDVNSTRPQALYNTSLRCIHNKALINKKFRSIPNLIFPKAVDDFGYEDAFPQQELISTVQWNSLLSFYHPVQFINDINGNDKFGDKNDIVNDNSDNDNSDTDIEGDSRIQVDSIDGIDNIDDIQEPKQDIDETIFEPFQIQLSYVDHVLTWNSPICQECIDNFENSNFKSRLDYHEGIINVLLINNDKNNEKNVVITSSRRKLRNKNIAISITANSFDTISLVKLKIYQEMEDEIFPMNQNLSYNGIELDNNQYRLRDYNVLVGDTIELKFLSSNNSSDLSMNCDWDGDATGKRSFENGFTGNYYIHELINNK